MSYVYVDSSSHLMVGILSDVFNWVEFRDVGTKKSSGIVHALIDNMLTRSNISIESLDGFIYCAGPGSYTGMRVAEGMAQIFEWQGIDIFSFYHFEVPRLLNIDSGCWIADAFKKELFCYSWDKGKDNIELMGIDQTIRFETENNIYTNVREKINFDGLQETSALIEQNPTLLFSQIVSNKMKKKPYYYRTLDQDFKKPN